MTREEILRNLENVYELYKDRPVHTFEVNIASMIRDVISFINENTIEPKRGKWIDREAQDYIEVKHRICSVCYQEPSAWSNHKKFKYCPNCGARME